MEWLDKLAITLSRSDVRGLLIAIVISWGFTQLVKNHPYLLKQDENVRIFRTRLVAFFSAAVPAFVLWPYDLSERVLIAVALGLASPSAYTFGARALYRFFPWLEPKMSAKPAAEPDKEPTP